jgi:hypothetical protein
MDGSGKSWLRRRGLRSVGEGVVPLGERDWIGVVGEDEVEEG